MAALGSEDWCNSSRPIIVTYRHGVYPGHHMRADVCAASTYSPIDWFHNRFSPAATSWGHSKCRGRLARDGPSPRIAAVRLGPWVQSEAPRLSLGRGGEPRAHSVPRSRISTPSFERHRGHNTASRPYSIAARLLKRDLVAIPSGQLNTPLRAGIAPGPATARRLAGTLALRPPERPTAARTHARRPTPAPAAHATATPRRDVRTARSAAYPSAVSLAHALAIVPQAFGVPG